MNSPKAPLPLPPRELPAGESRAIVLGHPASLLGALALAMAASLMWLFVAAYGIGFSDLRALAQPRLKLPARVVKSSPGQVWTGEPVHVTKAQFSHQGALYSVDSFSDTPAPFDEGQTVIVIAPQSSPEHGWVQGLQKFPLRLTALAKIGSIAVLPGLLLTLWGLRAGTRQRRLLCDGTLARAERSRHWGLPRPLAEQFLDSFEVPVAGKRRSFWSVGPEGPEQVEVLISPSGAVVVDQLLPCLTHQEQRIEGTSRARRISGWVVLLLGLGQLGVLALFLAT